MAGFIGTQISFEWNTTYPKTIQLRAAAMTAEIKRRMRAAAENEARIQRGMFLRTVRTWTDKPVFVIHSRATNDSVIATVATDSEIYRKVSVGTDVRYDLMTYGFRPKTHFRVIGSGAGKGGFAREVDYPLPGIRAREFVQEIRRRRHGIYYNRMHNIYYSVIGKHWKWTLGH